MTIYVFLPLAAAVLYGFSYAVFGVALKTMSVSTFVFYNFVFGLFFTACVLLWGKSDLDLYFYRDNLRSVFLLVLGITAAWGAWLITTNVMKNINPTYAAIGEIAYPVFVPVFAWIVFKDKQWDWPTICGGALIFSGLFIMIYFRTRSSV